MMYFMYLNRDMNFKSIRFRWFEETSRIRSRIQWNEWERGLVTTQTKFNRGLHAGITQDRDLSRGRWANPRRFESSLFAAAAAAYPWIRGFSENHAQTPFTISPLDFEYWGWILPIIIPPSDSCASLLRFHRTIVERMDRDTCFTSSFLYA